MDSPRTCSEPSDPTLWHGSDVFRMQERIFERGWFDVKGHFVAIDESRASRERVQGVWNTLIGFYRSRKLKFSSDKLPALSGLVKRFEGYLKDEYVVGM